MARTMVVTEIADVFNGLDEYTRSLLDHSDTDGNRISAAAHGHKWRLE